MYQIQDWSRGETRVFPYEIFGWERLKHFLKGKHVNFDKRDFMENYVLTKYF